MYDTVTRAELDSVRNDLDQQLDELRRAVEYLKEQLADERHARRTDVADLREQLARL